MEESARRIRGCDPHPEGARLTSFACLPKFVLCTNQGFSPGDLSERQNFIKNFVFNLENFDRASNIEFV